jgi:hypothetical protein
MNKLNRREFLGTTALAASASAALGAAPGVPQRSAMATLEGTGRVWPIWRNPGRFTKNPDIVRFPSGKMMLVFSDSDQHWAQGITRITTLETTDEGKTWGNPKVIAEADVRKGEERWITPRITLQKSGRLIVICDHDDYKHAHEDQPSGIWIWFSDDEGRTWSRPRLTGVPGLEPGRIIELPDGTLLMSSHMAFRDNFKNAEFVMRSRDGGLTWEDLSVIAKDRIHNFCEGQVLMLSSGVLACITRENNHNGYPSYVNFSYDQGHTWAPPKILPFSGDRPFVGQMSDGRVLVTYRNQSGNAGTNAWLGDLFADSGYQVFGIHYGDACEIQDGTLHIKNQTDGDTRYTLMPPENFRSNIVLEATLRVEGPADNAIATFSIGRIGLRAYVLRDQIWLDFGRGGQGPNPAHPTHPGADARHAVDMTKEHRLSFKTLRGRIWVEVDGVPVIHAVVTQEFPLSPTMFGRPKESRGDVWFRSVCYQAVNETEPGYSWVWEARSGKLPDQYQFDNILVVAPNPPEAGKTPDHGYSSWVQLPNGKIYMVDYSNRGDTPPSSHIYAALFSPDDFMTGAPK